MATDYEYQEDRLDHCLAPGHEEPEVDDDLSLEEWCVPQPITAKLLEDWYIKVHVSAEPDPVPVTGASLRFNRLKKDWIRGTEKLSILSQILLHPAYQQIIAIGPEAIPLILCSLESELDHWFWALKMLNDGVDVAEGATTLRAAADKWLIWGREKGHLG